MSIANTSNTENTTSTLTPEIIAMISNQLNEIHLGLASLMTTMDCLADSKSLTLSDTCAAALVLPMLTMVGNTYLQQLETVMLVIDKSLPA